MQLLAMQQEINFLMQSNIPSVQADALNKMPYAYSFSQALGMLKNQFKQQVRLHNFLNFLVNLLEGGTPITAQNLLAILQQ